MLSSRLEQTILKRLPGLIVKLTLLKLLTDCNLIRLLIKLTLLYLLSVLTRLLTLLCRLSLADHIPAHQQTLALGDVVEEV